MVVEKKLIAPTRVAVQRWNGPVTITASVTGAGARTPSYGPDYTSAPPDAIILEFLGHASLTRFHAPSER